MPRGIMHKVDIKSRVLRLKTDLYNGRYDRQNGDWHDGAHEMLNKVLDMINEYSN